MLVSAFWHGVHSGYYLSMLTVPFILAVEDFFDQKLRSKLSAKVHNYYPFMATGAQIGLLIFFTKWFKVTNRFTNRSLINVTNLFKSMPR